ncbi:MAG: formyltetrahydrofolate deformylase [Cohaesibacteraceae bacterium]
MTSPTVSDLILTISCPDRKGIVGAVGNSITAQDCNIVESAQFFDDKSGGFFMRIRLTPPNGHGPEAFTRGFEPVATAYDMAFDVMDVSVKPRVILMVSKFGHCLNDLLYRSQVGQLPMDLVAVVSNHETWRRRGESEDIPFVHLPMTKENKTEQEAELKALIERESVDLVVLARYMQILSDDLSRTLEGRVINIHHSFLPSFKGARPYHRAHDRGVKLVGATAHYVTPELDEGPIIEQDVIRVDHSMTSDQLVAAGRDVESQVLARAVLYHLERRILINDQKTVVFR